MTMIERFHPIGTPGQPWSAAEKAQWRAEQRVRRRYVDDVGVAIDALRERFDVAQYGTLDYGPGGKGVHPFNESWGRLLARITGA